MKAYTAEKLQIWMYLGATAFPMSGLGGTSGLRVETDRTKRKDMVLCVINIIGVARHARCHGLWWGWMGFAEVRGSLIFFI